MVDITINNYFAVRNTKLLNAYARIDDRVKVFLVYALSNYYFLLHSLA